MTLPVTLQGAAVLGSTGRSDALDAYAECIRGSVAGIDALAVLP